nr:MAG TPA: cytochrome c-552 [Caudoviricetes sp.]
MPARCFACHAEERRYRSMKEFKARSRALYPRHIP